MFYEQNYLLSNSFSTQLCQDNLWAETTDFSTKYRTWKHRNYVVGKFERILSDKSEEIKQKRNTIPKALPGQKGKMLCLTRRPTIQNI